MVLPLIEKYGSILAKGGVAEIAPEISRGILVEVLQTKNMTVNLIVDWIQKDYCLWDCVELKHRVYFSRLAKKVGSLDWITAPWIISSIKKDFPAVASLFLSWDEAMVWLEKQVVVMKKGMTETNT